MDCLSALHCHLWHVQVASQASEEENNGALLGSRALFWDDILYSVQHGVTRQVVSGTLLVRDMSSNGHHVSLDAVQAAIEHACAEFEASSLLCARVKAPAVLVPARQSLSKVCLKSRFSACFVPAL